MVAPQSSARLRRATVADAAWLSTFAARLFEQTFGTANTAADMQNYLASAFTPSKQLDELGEPRRVVWVAEDETGSPIGYAAVLRASRVEGVDAENPAEVERIYVDRSLHGAGVGDQLMDACIHEARSWKADVLWLAVWEENPRAIAFYEKRGFVRSGRKTFQLGSDLQHDYVMALRLS